MYTCDVWIIVNTTMYTPRLLQPFRVEARVKVWTWVYDGDSHGARFGVRVGPRYVDSIKLGILVGVRDRVGYRDVKKHKV